MSVTVMGSPEQGYLTPCKLRNGQIAIIRQTGIWPDHKGKVVQRVGNKLTIVGEETVWSDVGAMGTFRVEPLRNGTLLRVEDNE